MKYMQKLTFLKFSTKTNSLETKVKRGDISFGWFLVVYNILLTIFIGIVSIIPNFCFLTKLITIIIGSILLFRFCLFNSWFRNKIVGIFSKAKEMEETLKH